MQNIAYGTRHSRTTSEAGTAGSVLRRRRLTLPFLLVALFAMGASMFMLLPNVFADNHIIEYAEGGTDAVATFTADDPEGSTSITWSIAGTTGAPTLPTTGFTGANEDSDLFEIDEDGMLKFADSPDYEAPGGGSGNDSNTYNVVVAASDGAVEATGTEHGFHRVTVEVTDVDEAGKVAWTVAPDGSTVESVTQFDVGALLTASATDGDIAGADKAVTNAIWRWYRSPDDTSTGTLIEGDDAQDNTYTTTLDDAGMYLRVVAHYVVSGNVDQETASLTSAYPVLAERVGAHELKFDPDEIELSVAEGDDGATVGTVTATGNHGAVYYTLGGTDVSQFEIDAKSGQISTAVDLDYEADAAAANCVGNDDTCEVTVTARDASGDATTDVSATNPSATVTIKITDVDEKPTFPEAALTAVTRDENMAALADTGSEANVTYTATDPESRNIAYTLMGSDAAKFKLSATQVLSFRAEPDYETPTDRDRDNVYEVTVRASDGTMNADRMVKVTVTGVDEAPVVTGRDSVDYRENDEGVVATFTAMDPEGASSITWSLATGTNIDGVEAEDVADAADFMIDDETGELKFNIADTDDGSSPGSPDYENPQGAGTPANNTYNVVVLATDAATDGQTGFHKLTVKVTNVAEAGKVTWTVAPDGSTVQSVTQFDVGALLTATAEDGDISGDTKAFTAAGTGVTNVTWRWYKGSTLIDGETGNTYTTALGDEGQRIRATVTYQVGASTTQESASLTSTYPVLAERVGDNALEFDPDDPSRSVAEGDEGANVGAPVTATGNHGAVYYTLAGTDETRFEIDAKTGQITTMVDLDFEAAANAVDNCVTRNECTVTVTARDASGDVTGTPGDRDYQDHGRGRATDVR